MSVQNQIMWNRLISIVEEQAQALIRTAFSTSVREAGDLSAGIYDRRGRMLAQAVTGTPGHVRRTCPSHHSMSANCSRQLVRQYVLPALRCASSMPVRPNPRWSNAKTATPRAA